MNLQNAHINSKNNKVKQSPQKIRNLKFIIQTKEFQTRNLNKKKKNLKLIMRTLRQTPSRKET